MSEIHIALDIPPVLTGSPIPVTVNLRLTSLEEQVGVTGSADPLSVENRLTVAQEDIVTAQDTVDTHIADVANPHSVTKSQVGLGNADNTSDINKPVSTAQALADAEIGEAAAADATSKANAAQAAAIAASAPAAKGVTGGDSHSHDYTTLSNKPTLGSAAALDVGTTANKVVQLDGSARLPPVDGSQLTGIPSGGPSTQAFGIIAVSGQSSVVADAAPDTLTLVGVGAAITTDAATDTITITAEAAGAVAAHAGGTGVHAIASTTGLQTALDGKSSTSHDHAGVYDPAGSAAAAQAASAPAAKGVTGGDSHDHNGGDGAQIAYSTLSGLPTLGNSSTKNIGTTTGTVAAGDDPRLTTGLTGLTSGRVLFANSATTAGQDGGFFWDNINKRVGAGTSFPVAKIEINYSNTDPINTGGANSHLLLSNPIVDGQSVLAVVIDGVMRAKWRTDYVGNINWVASGGGYYFYTGGDVGTGSIKMSIVSNGNVGIGASPVSLFHVGNDHGVKLSEGISAWANTSVLETGWGFESNDYIDIMVPGSALNSARLRLAASGSVNLGIASSTTTDVTAVSIIPAWDVNTHATRKGTAAFGAWDYTGFREAIKVGANGSAATFSAFGVTPTTRPTALTTQLTTISYVDPGTPDYALQSVTIGGYGFATADEGNTLLKVVENLQVRLKEAEDKLKLLGWLQ